MKTNLLGRIVARSVSLGLTVGVSIAIAVIFAAPARAATLVGTTSDATGINGLVVDSITYNVTFIYASYDSVYSSSTPTFLGNASGATDAANSLQAALHTLGVTEITGAPTGYNTLLVPYVKVSNIVTNEDVFCSTVMGCDTASWGVEILTTPDDDGTDLDYTLFTATPLPAALPLFGTVLGVWGLLGWRRQRKTAAAAIAAS